MTDLPDAEARVRTARIKTVTGWSDHQRKRALAILASEWPIIFDGIRDQVEWDEGNEGDDRDG